MPAPSAGMTERELDSVQLGYALARLECELLHIRSGTAFVCWRGHRAIGDDGRCPTIARLGVSSLDLASPAPAGGALFAGTTSSARSLGGVSASGELGLLASPLWVGDGVRVHLLGHDSSTPTRPPPGSLRSPPSPQGGG